MTRFIDVCVKSENRATHSLNPYFMTVGYPSPVHIYNIAINIYTLSLSCVPQGETNNTADINLSRLSELLARSFCVALTPHLSELYTTGHTRLGLRTTLHQDNVSEALLHIHLFTLLHCIAASCINDICILIVYV